MVESKYSELGASATKAGLHQVLVNTGLSSQSNLFCQVLNDLSGDDNYLSFVHCDGTGTKTIVCYLIYKTTNDASIFGGLAQDALVMNLDDIYCLGAPQKLIVSNLIGRNAKLISDQIVEVIISSYKELCSHLRHLGIDIELGGGETADLGDIVRTLLVDAVMAGRIKKDNVINANNIKAGDIIVGLSNMGQTSYENRPNSSIASNGMTLARHCLLAHKYAELYPEVCDPAINKDFAYTGPFAVTDKHPKLDLTVGESLSSPTRTYAPILALAFKELAKEIHGCIHNTGGGQTKVLRFGQGNVYVKNDLFPIPPLFELIQNYGKVPWKEMYQVFNMGHRMEIYLPPQHLKTIIDIAKNFRLEAKQIGYVENNPNSEYKNIVKIKSPHGMFEYTL